MEEEKGMGDMRVKEGYTQDGTVDLKGRPILRSKGGRWKACSFTVGYELFERLAFFGVLTNLVVYLSTRLHEGTVKSANNVTNWIGTTWMLSILGAYVADTYLGRYWTFVVSSAVYFAGMCLLFLSVTLPALKPPICGPGVLPQDCNDRPSSFQVGIFYAALYIMALGNGGTKSNISAIGADQFDVYEPKEKAQKLSFFNWWMFTIYLGQLCANTVIVYIQDNVGWSLGYGLPTIGLAISTIVFLVGTPFYRHKVRSGSPFTHMAMVLVAALRKCKVPLPDEPKDLYELKPDEYARAQKRRIDHTPSLRILDKAAVKTGLSSPWRLCPVTRVEETKQMIKMIPVLIVTFVPAMVMAQVNTLFIKQGITLERSLGQNFDIPPACLGVFVTLSMLVSIVIYDCYFVPLVRRYTKNARGVTILQRMGIGIVLHIMVMLTAFLMERKRLQVIKDNGITGKSVIVPLPIFILLPQYVLMGVSASFFLVANLEFFYDQAPESMKSIGTSYYTSSLGIGQFLSSFLLKTVANITERRGTGWILDNINLSHLDYYYAFLGILSFLNLMLFLVFTKWYVYKVEPESEEE
ncbi:hypothetical protein C5167_005959 [Papaver somniferum]|uniref:Major facilitator superfamily (MFS) profile domain-containing protein n=1 Tax=Papaver somniferum TaxID=3469 RepID=A0A4Y7JBY8_PAPSO|nr:protein NRT1/ PTR FAMILY 5.2-like [Papaver somniferum]RZC58654.1 hypothetical protein C5167_005959 [Papaver somniferum]